MFLSSLVKGGMWSGQFGHCLTKVIFLMRMASPIQMAHGWLPPPMGPEDYTQSDEQTKSLALPKHLAFVDFPPQHITDGNRPFVTNSGTRPGFLQFSPQLPHNKRLRGRKYLP